MNRILIMLSLCCVSLPLWLGVASVVGAGCHSDVTAAEIRTDAHQVWDCTGAKRTVLGTAAVQLATQLLEIAVDRGLHAPAPTVDYTDVMSALAELRDDIKPCVIAVATGAVLSHVPTMSLVGAPVDRDPVVRQAFERLRIQRFGAATFVGVVGL